MENQTAAENDETEVNMTPMLDIVFIMLIFFIVTAVFVKEAGVDVLRPHAETAGEINRVSTLIGVSKDNRIWIDKQTVALDDVRAVVAKLKQENPKGKIVILADTGAHAGLVVRVIEQLNQLGVEGVSVATKN